MQASMASSKAGLLFQHYLPETYKNKNYVWFYLIKHSIAHNIQRPITGSETNNSFSRMRKEAVVALFNPLNPELNPICYLLALLKAHHFLHVSRIMVKLLTFRLLMSYMYGAPILDVSRSHTTTQHSR